MYEETEKAKLRDIVQNKVCFLINLLISSVAPKVALSKITTRCHCGFASCTSFICFGKELPVPLWLAFLL